MRKLALLVLLLCSLAAVAQQASDLDALTGKSGSAQAVPSDLSILTGKDRPAQRTYVAPNMYYGYGASAYRPPVTYYGAPPYTGPGTVPVTVPLTEPDVATLDAAPPVTFGVFGRRPFVVIGDGTRLTPFFAPFAFGSNAFVFSPDAFVFNNPFVFGPGFPPFGGVRFGPHRHFGAFRF